jgi:sulfotransferase family protein
MSHFNKNIVWLASYPKSGNTWFRIFLKNLLSKSYSSVDFENLNETPISSSRSIMDSYLGINSSDLTLNEISMLRPEVYKEISEGSTKPFFFKTHDAYTTNSRGLPIFPKEVTLGVIYIIRNPLDIAVSYSIHFGINIEDTIDILNDSEAHLGSSEVAINSQIQQFVKSWSDHVASWVKDSNLPIHVIRYEDMLANAKGTFKGAIRFLGMDYSNSDLENAIAKSSFKYLRSLEESEGFKERSIHSKYFFRNGKSNAWKQKLSGSQVKRLVTQHHDIMREFGYLN